MEDIFLVSKKPVRFKIKKAPWNLPRLQEPSSLLAASLVWYLQQERGFTLGVRAGQVSRMPQSPAVRIQSKQAEGMSNIWLWKTVIRKWGQLLCLAHSV